MNHKEVDDDFFNENEIKQKEDLTEDMDMSFIEPKKNHFFIIFLILFLFIGITGGIIYFLVINTPEKLFTTIFDKLIKENNNRISLEDYGFENNSFDYKLGFNISAEKKEYQTIINAINKITIDGTSIISESENMLGLSIIINYQKEELLNIATLTDFNDNATYLSMNNLFDKVVKYHLPEELNNSSVKEEEDKDYFVVANSLFKALNKALENAEYQRNFLKLDNQYLKKETLKINSEFVKTFYTKLLQDGEFLLSASKISDYSVEEISDAINKSMNNFKESDRYISVYTTILKNEFVMLECNMDGDKLEITKKDNTYSYEITIDYTLMYAGFIKINKDSKSNLVTINLNLIEEETNLEITLEFSKNDHIPKLLDKTNSIDYDKLTPEDESKISSTISSNKVLNKLLTDLNINTYLDNQNYSA